MVINELKLFKNLELIQMPIHTITLFLIGDKEKNAEFYVCHEHNLNQKQN